MNSFVAAGLIVLLAFIATVKISLQGKVAKLHIRTISDSVMYCACMFTVSALVFLLFSTGSFSATTVFFGFCFGFFTAVFQVAYALAMQAGSVSLVVLLCNFSMVIPMVAAFLLYDEALTPLKAFALILVFISILLSVRPQKSAKINLPWLIAAIVASLANGIALLVQRIFRASSHGAELGNFGFAGYLGAALLMWLVVLVLRPRAKSEERHFRLTRRVVMSLLIIGGLLGGYQFLYTYALGAMENLIFLPTYTLLALVLNYLSGYFLFKERVMKRQLIGFGIGTIAIVLLTIA